MKKIKFLLFILLLLMPFYVKAFDPTSTSCYLYEVASSGYDLDDIACNEIYFSSNGYNYVDLFKKSTKQFEKIILSDDYFYDLSFLSNISVDELIIQSANVDLRSYEGNVTNITFIDSIIYDDDFSGLVRNTKNFTRLSFSDCFINDFSTLPVSKIDSTVIIEHNKFPLPNLDVFADFKGDILDVEGIGYNLDSDVVESLNNNGVVIEGVDTNLIESDRETFLEWLGEVPFDNEELIFAPADYERIAIELADRLTPAGENGLSGDALRNYITGTGDSYVYALIGALMYQARGYTSFVVEVIHRNPDDDSLGSHYVICIEDGEDIYYSDPYYLDDSGQISEVMMGLGWPNLYFQIPQLNEYQMNEFVLQHIDIEPRIVYYVGDKQYLFEEYFADDNSPLPIPVSEGKDFLGWYFDEEFTNLASGRVDLVPGAMLYAKWSTTSPEVSEDDETPPQNNVDNPNTIKPPNTGSFAIPFILLLTLVLIFIMRINSKMFKRVFRI